jgi:hypothetical protein
MSIADARITDATGPGTRVHRAAPGFRQDSARGNAQPCIWWCRFREDHRPSVPSQSENALGPIDAFPGSRRGPIATRVARLSLD